MQKYSYTIFDGKICIEHRQLLKKKIIGSKLLAKKIASGKIKAVVSKKIKYPLLEFESLPNKTKKLVIKFFGLPPKLANDKAYLTIEHRMRMLEKSLNKVFGI